ncbi:hypothetical protein Cni_G06438 [Canna indica]|uniref:Response regulatory domain-containing protein n=1 Tax=Canna indica TaxID=4628 RepID=A0AAQ3K1I9_9LILI|nr:hypothetical protein Cni_G06438 [Canna indica]
MQIFPIFLADESLTQLSSFFSASIEARRCPPLNPFPLPSSSSSFSLHSRDHQEEEDADVWFCIDDDEVTCIHSNIAALSKPISKMNSRSPSPSSNRKNAVLFANGETQTVMKGITHGACNYLLKPMRIEELRNIWHHVIRKKKSKRRCHNDLNSKQNGEKAQITNSDDGQGVADHNGKVNKRKDQNEDDEDESEDNMQESEDSSTQKKA